jgi:hypothetical protein
LGDECLVDVERGRRDFLAETGDFADFLEVDDGAWLIAVNAEPGGIVASVFLAGEARA